MVQLNQAYDRIRQLGGELLAIQVECSQAGTRETVRRHNIRFPMANDDHLRVVTHYSPTSTYLIDRRGIVRARWLNSIHDRVGAEPILRALAKLSASHGPLDSAPNRPEQRDH